VKFKKYIPTIFVIVILLFSIGISIHYTFQDQESLKLDDISISDTRREEIQRYFGYEPLLSRYLTLPYDISINTNQHGSFVDIGFLYIILLPLVLLSMITRDLFKWFALGVLVIVFVISIHNSFILVDNIKVGTNELSSIDTMAEADNIDKFLHYVYSFSEVLYQPFGWLIDMLSGDQDYISYPILISSFLLILLVFYRFGIDLRRITSYLLILSITYAFFFLAFSSGIIWYGYLLFPLLLLGIMNFVQRLEDGKSDTLQSTTRIAVVFLSIVWIVMTFVIRISNLQANFPEEHQGKAIISADVYHYNTGIIKSASQLQDEFIAPGFSEAMKRINLNSTARVLKIGTGLTYFINQNHERVIYDNQLGLFSRILETHRNKFIISDFLKASGIQYLIIDLNTPSIDNTPERTLTIKYNELLSYLINNQSIQLLCTDNISRKEGTNSVSYSLTGETIRKGNFAIYEIN